MARPFLFTDGFETGAHGMTASSGTLIDYPHFTELARQGMTPYRGSYCLRVRLAGGTTSQFAREDTAFDDLDNAGAARFVRFYFYLGKDLVMANSDKFSLIEIESVAATTTETAAGVLRNGANLEFWFNETQAAAGATTKVLGPFAPGFGCCLGKWYHVELKMLYAAGTGTLDGWLDDSPLTQITTLTTADAVDAAFGVIGPDAGTSGTVLIDDIVYDDLQIFRDKERFPATNRLVYHASDHPIIGPACFSAAFTSTGTDAVLRMYDTDGIPTNLDGIVGAPFSPISAKEVVFSQDILEVKYGLYTVITGTATDNKELSLSIEKGGIPSEGGMVAYGAATKTPLPR
jgi:hypothetical protein